MSGHSLITSANDAGTGDFLTLADITVGNVRRAHRTVKRESETVATSEDKRRMENETPADRLRALRRAAGFRSAAAASRVIPGVNLTTYQQHEKGRRPLTQAAAATYAEFFGVPAGYVLYGEPLRDIPEVPIVGVIGTGGAVSDIAEGGMDAYAQAPEGLGLAAFRVVTGDLWPAYHAGDLAFFSPHGLAQPIDPAAINGRECIVVLADGSRLLRFVTMQSATHAALMAYAGPPMMNVAIRAATPVLWIRRAP
jgi:hypothetical protein